MIYWEKTQRVLEFYLNFLLAEVKALLLNIIFVVVFDPIYDQQN